jgi:tetratricopeptide (TPR) repeat protein
MKKTLIASFLLCAGALPGQEQEFGSTVATTLTAVRSDPDAFRNVKVEFVVQFASLCSLSNPFFTRFTPNEYANLYAWADEQPIWQQGEYENPFGQLFYSKDATKLAEVFALRPYQRLKVQGVIRNTFQNSPWIEVFDFTPVSGAVDTQTLTHLYRGEKFMAERQWQKAIAELNLAPGPNVPASAQKAAYRNMGICHLRVGESDQAVSCLKTARAIGGTADSEIERLLANAESKPSTELDRTVGQNGLKDYEKPMWDAFEKDARTAPSSPR